MKPLTFGMLATVVAAACRGDIVNPVVVSVAVSPGTDTLAVSETITLTAAALDASGTPIAGQTFVWISNDPDVAPVTAAGIVTATEPGVALIQATARGIVGTARLTVTPGPVSVVRVSPDNSVADIGAPRAFEATVEDAFGNAVVHPPAWTSSDPTVATVDPTTGQAVGVSPGQALIVATVEQIADTSTLVVVALAFQDISAGDDYTCAVSNGSSAYCWGANDFGVRGNGVEGGNAIAAPARVPSDYEFSVIAAGTDHTCARTRSGGALCWGRNNSGQIGDNTTQTRPNPTPVMGTTNYIGIGVGLRHSCGLATTGAGACWGLNDLGQLGSPIPASGLGPSPPNPLPIMMQGSPPFDVLTIGTRHGCGLTGNGTAYCWGDGSGGAVGDNNNTSRAAAVPVSGGHAFQSIAAGNDFSCGVTTAGEAWCWGENAAGQLGRGDSTRALGPVAVSSVLSFTAIATGGAHACAITDAGAAYCWGAGSAGQLGDGASTGSPTPVPVSGGYTFNRLDLGTAHSCGITTGGVTYCWGANASGQLGDGSNTPRSTPARVSGQ